MYQEDDKFHVSDKYLQMSVAELDKAQDKKYKELLKEKEKKRARTKRTAKPCKVAFHI